MHATLEIEAAQTKPATQPAIRIEGQDAWIATPESISSGIAAASAVFDRYGVDPVACAKANDKLFRGNELLTEQEAHLCLIWDEADYAAFHLITVGWLSRDIDIQIVVR
ncbi:hypothetical protein [Sulfuriferula nivalis]|uniref:Uncharacterized protein n=1 Tax=Sulfuriferula nivalis TaxID=2675298 RepID=A0A809S7C6_9PROT|nr:hypothetical protein [Sulfuriferula nivalis]BBO99672.1 hypothetical protein SFSGTM_03810 [Sulfuriferula nivalis]